MDDKFFLESFENIPDLNAMDKNNVHKATDAECSMPPNENDIEEFCTLLEPQVLTKKQWRIIKFPLNSKKYSIKSPVLTEIYGHSVRLHVFTWQESENQMGSEAKIGVIRQKLPEATEDDVINWQDVQFQISVNNEMIETDRYGRFSLGSTTDIEKMLHGEDLILKLSVGNNQLKTGPESHTKELRGNSTWNAAAILMALLMLISFIDFIGSPQGEQQDLKFCKQSIISMNENLRNGAVDVFRLTEIVNNHKDVLSTVEDELKLLQKMQQNFEKKIRKLNDPKPEDKKKEDEKREDKKEERHDNIFIDFTKRLRLMLDKLM